MNIPPWMKGHPTYVYVYWAAVLVGGSYYGVEWLLTPKPVKEEKKWSLSEMNDAQLYKLKQQRMEQLKKINDENQE